MAAQTNAKGLFAEFYFVVIVISIFGLGNVAHNGFTSAKRPHVSVAAMGLILVRLLCCCFNRGNRPFWRINQSVSPERYFSVNPHAHG